MSDTVTRRRFLGTVAATGNNLAGVIGVNFLARIMTLKASGDKTILLVEHKMDVVRELSDRIIVLHNGALVAEGEPAEVFASPIVQEAYLGIEAAA